MTAAATPAAAQEASASGDASALVLEPFSLINVEELDFGSIVAAATTGNIVLAPGGNVTTTGGVIVAAGSARPARFAGQGSSNRVVIRSGSNQIFLTGPGPQMRLNNFTFGALWGLTRNGNGNNYRITSADGIVGFSVGGTLRVNANQAEGLYSGSFTVIFNYQ